MSTQERSSTELTTQLLRHTALFSDVDSWSLEELSYLVEWTTLAPEEFLFREGDPGGSLFVLLIGRLEVLKELPDGGIQTLAQLGPGEPIGEMTVFSDQTRSATVLALTDAVLVRISKPAFHKIVVHHPSVLVKLNQIISERLRQQGEAAVQKDSIPRDSRALVILAATPGAPCAAFAASMAEILGRSRRVLLVDQALVERTLGIDIAETQTHDTTNFRLAAWFNQQEHDHDLVLLVAPQGSGPWTRRCLNEASHVLLLGAAADGLEALTEGATLRERIQRRTLVLFHEAFTVAPSGTRRWLDRLDVNDYHHARAGRVADIERLCRFLTGEAIALVLGGGSVRGAAHVGVLRALEEAEVPIDLVCGTSMGALVAAQIARGLGSPELGEYMAKTFSLRDTIFDYTMPVRAITAGRALRTTLEHTFGEMEVEDLWLRFFCPATNLTRANLAVLDQGPLAVAVLASMAVPGLFPPVKRDDDLLVDGALLDNLPVNLVPRYARARIIAVNVMGHQDTTGHASYKAEDGGLNVLWRRLRPFGRSAEPMIVDLLLQSIFLTAASAAERLRNEVDLYLAPNMERFGLLEEGIIEEMITVGYDHARPRVRSWLAEGTPSRS
jgi:predicted acylesterase/phospholipase RssA/CRP-like cAMP-binding protein